MTSALFAIALAVSSNGAAVTLPEPEPLDTRLYDEFTVVVAPRGPLFDERTDPRTIPIRLAPAIGIPTGALMIGLTTWSGIAGRTGDSGLPLMQIGAGMGAGMAGATFATLGTLAFVDPDRSPFVAIAIPVVLLPVAAGAGTWAVSQKLEGASRHEDETLACAIAGAFAGEALFVGSVLATRAMIGGPGMWLSFVPVGAGATLGYRLARGESGRASPLWRAPVTLTVIF